ncbi:MAG TPA: SDR family NAD(P)-dependent oxidoreductase [Polyangiaceae bacterium]|jgi:NAD(P)-dependent dehydrogenase (short-subunit alcohol dehydrogenase family)
MRYRDKVVIVTGGSRGIGAGCVDVFVREGGSTVVFCSPNEGEGKAYEKKINAAGPGRAEFVRADVTQSDDLQYLVETAATRHGRIDCLVNNAGWHPPNKPIDDFSVDDFRSLLELNLVSVFAACRWALPHLRKVKGNIINISSLVGAMGQVGATTYVATKGAVTAFTKALAVDEAAHEVRVNAVSPGNIFTPLWQEAIERAPDPAACRAEGDAAQLLGRMGSIEEAGRLCLFLAADATFTTGVDHFLTGGAELAYGRKTRR